MRALQLVQWNIFIQREVNSLPDLPREFWPCVHSCTCFRRGKALMSHNCDLRDAKNPYDLLKRTSTFLPGNTRVWEKESSSPSPYTVRVPDCADARFGSHLCYTFGWRSTCSPPWPAAIQNGDWSAQKLCMEEKKKERTRVSQRYASIKQIISHESPLQKAIHSLGAWCQRSCSYNILGLFSLFLTPCIACVGRPSMPLILSTTNLDSNTDS